MEKMQYKDKLDISDDITFGFEIEVEDVYLYQLKRGLNELGLFWKVYYDYSLKDNGGEISTSILKNTKKTYSDLKKTCDMLKKIGANPNKNASMQIHYSTSIFKNDYKNLLNFYKLWSIYENVIYRYSYGVSGIPRQTIYDYADVCAKKINSMLNTKDYIPFAEYNNKKFVNSIDNYSLLLGNNRTYGLSFRYDDIKNYCDVKTIEIRTINGTIDEVLIQNYLKFFYELLSYSSKTNFDKDLINYKYQKIDYSKNSINSSLKINEKDALELSNLVLDTEYDRNCFMNQYVGDSKVRKL